LGESRRQRRPQETGGGGEGHGHFSMNKLLGLGGDSFGHREAPHDMLWDTLDDEATINQCQYTTVECKLNQKKGYRMVNQDI
jgi:hypothetical protein